MDDFIDDEEIETQQETLPEEEKQDEPPAANEATPSLAGTDEIPEEDDGHPMTERLYQLDKKFADAKNHFEILGLPHGEGPEFQSGFSHRQISCPIDTNVPSLDGHRPLRESRPYLQEMGWLHLLLEVRLVSLLLAMSPVVFLFLHHQ